MHVDLGLPECTGNERKGAPRASLAQAPRRRNCHYLEVCHWGLLRLKLSRRADRIFCAEVLDRYASKAPVARPKELAQPLEALLDYWGELTLDDIDEDSCADFVEVVGSSSYGRRRLEDFAP